MVRNSLCVLAILAGLVSMLAAPPKVFAQIEEEINGAEIVPEGESYEFSDDGEVVYDDFGPETWTGSWPGSRLWVDIEYLWWWTKGMNVPPLVTMSPDGTPVADAGVLPGATILFGNDQIVTQDRSGGRINAVWWNDPWQTFGIGGGFFGLEDESQVFSVGTPQFSVLGRPFFNVETGQMDAELVSFPNVLDGTVTVNTNNKVFGAEIYGRSNARLGTTARLDGIGGFRYLNLEENLVVTEALVVTDPGGQVAQGTTIDLFDQFKTENQFYGLDLGMVLDYRRGRGSIEVLGKIAWGAVHERVEINGATTTTAPTVPPISSTSSGGLLAQGTNIGSYTDTHFAVLPELNIKLGYQLTPRLQATLGYTLIYLSHVARPGDQIDFGVNPTQLTGGTLVGEARPSFSFHDSEFWMQGLSAGIDWRF